MTRYDDMLVGELKKWPKVYQSLKAQWDESYAGELFTDDSRVIDAFLWSNVKEDEFFWGAIHGRKTDRARAIHPHMFEEDKLLDNNSWTIGGAGEITDNISISLNPRDNLRSFFNMPNAYQGAVEPLYSTVGTFLEKPKEWDPTATVMLDPTIDKVIADITLTLDEPSEEDEDFPHDEDLDLITNLIINCDNVYNGHNQIEVKKGHLSFKELETVIHELAAFYDELNVEYICFPDGSGNLSLKDYWGKDEHPNGHTDKLLFGWGID